MENPHWKFEIRHWRLHNLKTLAEKKVKIQYYRSAIGFAQKQKLIVKGLGLNKLNTTREVLDTPAMRGMVAKVPHLVRIVE
jgi:large subunit ribosomal protein L30